VTKKGDKKEEKKAGEKNKQAKSDKPKAGDSNKKAKKPTS